MNKQATKLIKEVEYLIELAGKLIDYGKSNGGKTMPDKIREFTFWTTRTGELINLVYPNENQYHLTFNTFRHKMRMDSLHIGTFRHLFEIIGILEAIKYELENGLLDDIRNLLQADIFADFLEMGEHLLNEGYKDAAAVIIGSVLEDTLRKLAEKNSIPVVNDKGKALTIEPINVELAKNEIYNQLVKKQVTSWADLRNNAAHGHFGEYDKKQVENMLLFVQAFAGDFLK